MLHTMEIMVSHDHFSIVCRTLTFLKDFDFGEDVLANLSQGCTFPWLLANAVHADGRLMATAKEYLVLEKKGYRIGFFGLAGTFVECARKILFACLLKGYLQ